MNTELGLRERKKQRTRETIARAARELFAERGYHDTTLPEIAEAADVSTRTIFAYFPSKEDILFSDFPVMKEALAQALAERPEGEDALETVRKFILSLHEYKRDDLDEKMRLCIESDETLRSHLRARLASLEELIAPAIAKDLDAAEDDLRPQVVAASLTAAFNVLTERGEGPRGKPKTEDDVAAQIDPIITFLRGGLAARGLEYLNTDYPSVTLYPDGEAAFLLRSADANAEELDRHAVGDGNAWRQMLDGFFPNADLAFGVLGTELWAKDGLALGVKACRRLGRRGLAEFTGNALASSRDWLTSSFASERAHGLLAPWVLP